MRVRRAKLLPAFPGVLAGVDTAVGEGDEQRVRVARLDLQRADHVGVLDGQAARERAPVLAAIVAAQDDRLRSAELLGQVDPVAAGGKRTAARRTEALPAGRVV